MWPRAIVIGGPTFKQPPEVFLVRRNEFDFPIDQGYLGWNTLAMDGVELHDVNVSLGSWFDEPEVIEFAKKLQSCLDKAYSVRLYV